MGAPLKGSRRRGAAALASGVVIALTALTAGVAPAAAQPGSDDVVTTVAPEPEVSAPEQEVTAEQPTTAPDPRLQDAPQKQEPAVVEPEPAPEPAPAPAPKPEAEPAPEPEPQTVAPPTTSAAVQTAEPTASSAEPSTFVERAPATSVDPSTTSTSAALAQASDSGTPTSRGSTGTPTSESEAAAEQDGDGSETPTVSIEQAAKEIKTLAPQTLEAPAQDVQLAKKAEPIVEREPVAAPEQDVNAFKQSVDLSLGLNGLKASASAKVELEAKRGRDFELISNVRQWRPDWIEYDEFYRPVLMNPFRAPVRIVYVYDMRPRIVYIPPLTRFVLEAAQFAAYSFTAAVLSPINLAANFAQAATNIAVGSFFGGGYFPGAGLPLPPPPPPVLRYDNVPVLVNYSNARYEPFRVRQIVDVGEDPVYGGRKVLLDGATPAWGEWTQTASGERQFEVRRTQQFPGLSEPAEGPLPGDYRLRLASDEGSTGGLTGRNIFLMVAAGVIGTLGFGAIGLAFFLGRRRPEH